MQHINMTYLSKCCKSSHHFEYAPYFTMKFEIMAEPAEFMTMDYFWIHALVSGNCVDPVFVCFYKKERLFCVQRPGTGIIFCIITYNNYICSDTEYTGTGASLWRNLREGPANCAVLSGFEQPQNIFERNKSTWNCSGTSMIKPVPGNSFRGSILLLSLLSPGRS